MTKKYYVDGKGYIDLDPLEVPRFLQTYPNAKEVQPPKQQQLIQPQAPMQQAATEQVQPSQPAPKTYRDMLNLTNINREVAAPSSTIPPQAAMLEERQRKLNAPKQTMLTPQQAKSAQAGYAKGEKLAQQWDEQYGLGKFEGNTGIARLWNAISKGTTDVMTGLRNSILSIPGLGVSPLLLDPYSTQMIKGYLDKTYALHGYAGEDMDMIGALKNLEIDRAAAMGFKTFIQSAPQTASTRAGEVHCALKAMGPDRRVPPPKRSRDKAPRPRTSNSPRAIIRTERKR